VSGITVFCNKILNPKPQTSPLQMIVIECMEDGDETLRRKTLDLLYKMTSPQNVEVVVDRMMIYLTPTADDFLRKDLCSKVSSLAEKFAPSNAW
jgi:AP-4 complex subunit epsilon-1